MHEVILYVTLALAISVVLNILFKRLGISQVIGYILTGTIIAYAFDLKHLADSKALGEIAEFGIVFLMFTIGLEMLLERLRSLRRFVFINGGLQVSVTAVILFLVTRYLLGIDVTSALIIALSLSLSSTAVVLAYLKHSKEIHLPYGQRAMGILIFQDIAVIPILLLIGFLQHREASIALLLFDTLVGAAVLLVLFVAGRRLVGWILRFAADTGEEELFIGLVLVITVGASLGANELGFTYSLGAFIAGMAIAETHYLHKVESDISAFRDLLLGTFFVTVGLKIDLGYLVAHAGQILLLLLAVMVLKGLLIYAVVRPGSSRSVALESALSLAQIGEFSFAIFALAMNGGLLDSELEQTLIMMAVLSMVITPFYLGRVHPLVSRHLRPEEPHAELTPPLGRSGHVIVCGYSVVGKIVARDLCARGIDYVVVDNSMKHVREGLDRGEPIYLGDLSKRSVAEALSLEKAAVVIVTLDNPEKKRLVCETVLEVNPDANLVVKILTLEEKALLADLGIREMVDSKQEVAHILVDRAMRCRVGEREPMSGTPLH
jgi:Kef-type K+ transport systems, membrane components